MARHLPALLLAILLLGAGCARHKGGAIDNPALDASVEQALRGALLSDIVEIQRAMRRIPILDDEETGDRAASAAALLAASTARPIPDKRRARQEFPRPARTQATRSWELLLDSVEPRQRYLEARADRRYDGLQRSIDATLSPFASAIQGQFFPLVTLPFAAADWMLAGRVYLTPEQRRELRNARRVAADPSIDEPRAADIAERWRPRRRELGILQARMNGRAAMEAGELETALFWFQREAALRPPEDPPRELETVRQRLSGERLSRRQSLAMTDADEVFSTRAEFADYGELLRLYFIDPTSREFGDAVRSFRVTYPWSAMNPVVDAAMAAEARLRGEERLAGVRLAGLARSDDPFWGGGARALLLRPSYNPQHTMEVAQRQINARFWDFLLEGTDPYRPPGSHTAEEARRQRTIWVDRARALFVTDILSRFLFLPFLDPFPRDELPDAAGRIDDAWLDRPEGRPWLRRLARAREIQRRHDAAAQTWERLGDDRRARRAEQRAARHLERLARQAPDPRQAAAIYQRILNAWPMYSNVERVRREHGRAQARASAIARIPRPVLKSYPALAAEDALAIPSTLLDGSRRNGEIAREGVHILPWGAYLYQDERTGRDIEVPLAEENMARVQALAFERQRLALEHDEVRQRRARRRIPLEVEAGVFPGFDVSPGLVPLSPDMRERMLYE